MAEESQTRNIPAGTVQDPGSHLTYIIDTGLNARAIAGQRDIVGRFGGPDRLWRRAAVQPFLDADLDGRLDAGALYQNFISITNVHPTRGP